MDSNLIDSAAVGANMAERGAPEAVRKSTRPATDALLSLLGKVEKKHREQAISGIRSRLSDVQPEPDVLQLPLWPESVRGVPNDLLRSAVFGAFGRGRRRYMKGDRVATFDGLTILYTGERLDQVDLDVWESVLHLVRRHGLGRRCRVTSYALLKLMGKTDTGKNRKALHACLIRLRANAVEIRQDRYCYIGGLIEEAFKDNETQEWIIVVSIKLCALFATGQFTQIDWTVRRDLSGKPLAQWLHGFYASHAKPYPMRSDTLLKLAGSEDGSSSSGRQTLRKALLALTDASETHGQPFSFDIREGVVHVEKKPTNSQRRHLAKKASGRR
jgi:hypothetical protein